MDASHVENDLVNALDPARFLLRDARRPEAETDES